MTNNDCFYCTKDERLDHLMIEMTTLKTSTLYLLKDQTYRGRCVLAFNKHKKELFELSDQERMMFMDDVSKAAEMIDQAFNPNKINYAIYGDLVSHLHVHLVPKYMDGMNWGEPFENMPEKKKLLSNDEYQKIIDRLLGESRVT